MTISNMFRPYLTALFPQVGTFKNNGSGSWSRRGLLKGSLAVLILCGAMSSAGLAQGGGGGSLHGVVEDPSGAVVPNAAVSLTNDSTGVVFGTHATSTGEFVYPVVPSSTYTLTTTANGFNSTVIKNVVVSLNQTTTQRVTLQIGSADVSVQVSSAALTLDTEDAQQTTTIDPETFQALPIAVNGGARSPSAILNLFPGVSDTSSNQGGAQNQAFSASINGGQSYGGEVIYDGAIITISNVAGDYRQQPIPVDSLHEFTLVQNPFSAQYGNTPGGILSFNTQSGAKLFHGQGYEYLRNDATNAAGYFAVAPDANGVLHTVRPQTHQNEFGGNFSGPVWIPKLYNRKDRTFFFGWYDGFRLKNNSSATGATVPTTAQRAGDFSSYVDSNGKVIPIYDPQTTVSDGNGGFTRTQFSYKGRPNVIDPARFAAQAKAFLSYMPDPINSNQNNNALSHNVNAQVTNRWGFRIDHTLTSKLQIHGVYAHYNNGGPNLYGAYQGIFNPGNINADPGQLIRVGADWTVSPSLINNFTFGYNHDSQGFVGSGIGSGALQKLGIGGLDSQDAPQIQMAGYEQAGTSSSEVVDEGGYVARDALTLIHGHHTFSFGVEYDLFKDTDNLIGKVGQLSFQPGETGQPDTPTAPSGNSFASFLLGQVDYGSISYNVTSPQDRYSFISAYAQDDFKLTPRLTINVGLRYDIKNTRTSPNNDISSFDPNLPNPGAGNRLGALSFIGNGPGRNGRSRFSDVVYNRFQPRIGFSAQVLKNTVVRGGYAVFNGSTGDVLENGIRNYSDGFNANPTFVAKNNISPAFTLDGGFPTFAKPPFLSPSLDNGGTIGYLSSKDGQTAILQNYTLDVQQMLPSGFLLDIAYVGNSGHHLGGNLNLVNQANPSILSLGYNLLNADINSPQAQSAGIPLPYPGYTGTVAQALRPYPQYRGINQFNQTNGASNYNALQAKLQKTVSDGFSMLVSYTYSKMMSNVDQQQGWYSFGGSYGGGPQNTFDRSHEWSASPVNVPQILSIAGVYALPFGHGKKLANHGVSAAVFGGFSFSGILHYQAGSPLRIQQGDGLPLGNGRQDPTMVSGQPLKAHWSGRFNPVTDVYANIDASVNTAPLAFGNAPRTFSGFRSFAYYNEDFSIKKQIDIFERLHATLGVDGFNVLNRTQFGSPDTYGPKNPDGTGGNTDYGHINYQSNLPRQLQGNFRIQF